MAGPIASHASIRSVQLGWYHQRQPIPCNVPLLPAPISRLRPNGAREVLTLPNVLSVTLANCFVTRNMLSNFTTSNTMKDLSLHSVFMRSNHFDGLPWYDFMRSVRLGKQQLEYIDFRACGHVLQAPSIPLCPADLCPYDECEEYCFIVPEGNDLDLQEFFTLSRFDTRRQVVISDTTRFDGILHNNL